MDNWKHRSTNMKCGTCMWFIRKLPDIPPSIGPQSESSNPKTWEIGRCRRHAPMMNGWPVMFITDWCGDHKLDENKL